MSTERKFGLSVGGMLLLFAALATWRDHTTIAGVFAVAGGLLVLGAVVAPAWLAPVERRWMAFAVVLGAFNARLVLTLSYYLIITPAGLIMRLVRHDPLDREVGSAASYWRRRPRDSHVSIERYTRQS